MPVEFDISISGSNGSKYLYRSNRHKSTALTPNGDVAISPKIKMESNKASSLEFIITPANECYDDIEKKKTMVYMRRDGKYIFRGRVSDVKVDIFRQKTITCESDLSFLSDSVQPPNKSTKTENVQNTKKKKRNTLYHSVITGGHGSSKDNIKMSVRDYFSSLITEHNNQMTDAIKHFTVGTVNIDEANSVETFERTSFQDTSSVINSDLLSVYGGILQTRYTGDAVYIDWLKDYDDVCDQQIRFGVNLIELDQESPNDSEWSVLLPVGDENITIESVNSGSKYLESSSAVQKYGRIVHYHKFNNAKKPAELLAKAQKYMAVHGKVFPDSIIVKAIDLQLIDGESTPLELGEKIKVLSSPHGINKTMSCIAMELDIENPENNSYTIGVIMPPDKEKKKDTLSSKHSSSSKRSSGGIGSNRNAIEGLQEDVNVNSNNINVNAENIAVNALNIAVNAENIAVVAKNIAIAADTIDIKAQQITKTFGDEADDLYGYIQESAEGIKTHFTDKTSGLSSDISIKAGEISSAIQNADGSIRSKITQTEESLTLEFNKKIYGENQDGTGGIYHDYTSKIQSSAEGVTEYFEDTMWGDNGTPDNPTDDSILGKYTADYKRTAAAEVTKFKLEMYGEGGTATDPKNGSTLYAVYTKSATEWKNVLWGEGGSQSSPKEGSILKQTKDGLDSRVVKGEIASTINQTAQSVLIQAEKINLSGYVTVSQLSATNANITNLMNGTTVATKIYATELKATTGRLDIGDYNNSAKLYYRGYEYYSLTVSMPGVTGSFDALGYYYKSGYQTSLSLAHSHSVSTGSDGTITIGGSVATDATNRSFRIADTKAYKDGVSAAFNSVTVDSVGRNGTDYVDQNDTVGLSQQSSYVMWYDGNSSDHRTWVRIRADASNGKHREASIYVPGTNAYNAVTIDDIVRHPNYNNGNDSYDSSTHNTTIYIRAEATNGNAGGKSFVVSGSNAYSDGQDSVTVNEIIRHPSYNSGNDRYNSSSHDTTIYIRAAASNGSAMGKSFVVSGSNAYSDGQDSVTVGAPDRRKSDSYNSSTHNTTIYLKATASNGKSNTNDITISGSSAYSAGRASVDMNDVTINSVTMYNGYAMVSLSLPNAAGTKRCDNAYINIDL